MDYRSCREAHYQMLRVWAERGVRGGRGEMLHRPLLEDLLDKLRQMHLGCAAEELETKYSIQWCDAPRQVGPKKKKIKKLMRPSIVRSKTRWRRQSERKDEVLKANNRFYFPSHQWDWELYLWPPNSQDQNDQRRLDFIILCEGLSAIFFYKKILYQSHTAVMKLALIYWSLTLINRVKHLAKLCLKSTESFHWHF